jgi:hypothetical protein
MKNKFVLLACLLTIAGLSLVAVQTYNDVREQRRANDVTSIKKVQAQKSQQQAVQEKYVARINDLYAKCVQANGLLIQYKIVNRLDCGLIPLQ